MVMNSTDVLGYENVITSVAQGSVLGVFHVLIFVNDLSCNIPSIPVLYADDITLIC